MTQREQLERLKMILIELKEFLKIASEACQDLTCENWLVGGPADENGFPNLPVDGGAELGG